VAELKAELKLRGLLVSGTKNDLVERLRMHHDRSKGSPSVAVALDRVSPGAATTAAANARVPKCENPPRSPPPVSPVAFKVSRMGLEESGGTDSETRPALPAGSPGKEAAGPLGGLCRGLEKDQRLHEKERQIEELMRQLEREQKLVEELKLQLEVEKRGGPQEESKPCLEPLERGLPGLYLSCFDMLLTEDATWLLKLSDGAAAPAALFPPGHRAPGGLAPEPSRGEPEQCPVIDSQGPSLSPGDLSGQEEERSLEQVQTMVVGEVLKDIATACKLLNITPGEAASIVLSLSLSLLPGDL
jgi:hypothetical protein